MEEALYLIKVSICVGVFYLIYLIFYNNTTFFQANRIYLLGGVIISFLLPAIPLSFVPMDYHWQPAESVISVAITSTHKQVQSTEARNPHIDFYFILCVVYLIGFAFMIFRLLFSIIKIFKLKNRSRVHVKGGISIVETGIPSPFSFFNIIFLPSVNVNPIIFDHEKVHIHQLHWMDLLVMEMACAILWFNPIIFFYRNAVKLQHEYQADEYTVRKGVRLEHYLDCMLLQIQAENGVSPISEFYSETIKKRINMITKDKTARKFSTFYLFSLPAVCMLLFAFSHQRSASLVNNISAEANDRNTIIIVDAGHGGEDAGAKPTDGISEKSFVLSVAKAVQTAGEKKGVTVILTRMGDEALALDQRVAFSNRFSADLFISLHANYNQQNTNQSGLECIVSEENMKYEESKAFAQLVVNHLQDLRGIAVNGIKNSSAYVLKNNTMPAVMVELGYLSNKKDYAFISDDKNQQLISEKIIDAVLSFRK